MFLLLLYQFIINIIQQFNNRIVILLSFKIKIYINKHKLFMGRLFLEYLEGNNIYTCSTCNIHLTSYNELISKVRNNF